MVVLGTKEDFPSASMVHPCSHLDIVLTSVLTLQLLRSKQVAVYKLLAVGVNKLNKAVSLFMSLQMVLKRDPYIGKLPPNPPKNAVFVNGDN